MAQNATTQNEAPVSIIKGLTSTLHGERLLVLEQKLRPDQERYWPIRLVADTPREIDDANKDARNPKAYPFGGRVRPVTDEAEAAMLAKLPREGQAPVDFYSGLARSAQEAAYTDAGR